MPRLLACALALFVLSGGASSQPDQRGRGQPTEPGLLRGGTGTIYVGGYPRHIWIIDEAKAAVVGAIPLKAGIPIWWSTLSRDRRRFYVVASSLETVEIVDLATRRTVDLVTLSSATTRVRIFALAPDPSHRTLALLTKAATKLEDRFEIGRATLVHYDLRTHQVRRAVAWPIDEEDEDLDVKLFFSPDGRLLYIFGDETLVYDTETLTEIDRWALGRPVREGFDRLEMGAFETTYDAPGVLTGLFTVHDPVQRRPLLGLGRVDLAARSVEIATLGPAAEVSFALAPDGKRAYGLRHDIGHDELWTFDLEARRVIARTPIPGRPRMALKVSSNGRVLYIYQAGHTIDLHEAGSFRRLGTVALDGDMTTELFVVPPS